MIKPTIRTPEQWVSSYYPAAKPEHFMFARLKDLIAWSRKTRYGLLILV